jgi:hypothetical protein
MYDRRRKLLERESKMQIGIKKIGERDGKERFVLCNRTTGEQIVKKDVSEPTMRNWLASRDFPSELVDRCFELARKKFEEAKGPDAEPEDSDEMDLDFFLAELEDEDS